METFKPETADQVLETVKWAVSEETPLDIRGRGSKRQFGRPTGAVQALDLSALSGILDYEPSELVLAAQAATPMADIEAALAEQNQMLAFEPIDLGPLLGGDAGAGSVAGAVLCNLTGPRRVKAGAARDHFLGFNAVSGRGEVFKSGGRVVKNVTGFDLSKLIAGSFGTLAVVTDVTVKVLPAPEKTRTVLIQWATDGIYDHGGVKAMTDALGSAHEVSAAAHLPAAVAGRSSLDYVNATGRAVTAVRVEGPAPSVAHRADALHKLLRPYGAIEELHSSNSQVLWREIRDARFFADGGDRQVWRLSVPPVEGSRVALRILEGHPGEVFYDWGGGLVWLAVGPTDDALEPVVRKCVADVDGHATLIRADEAQRARLPVFQPQPGPVADLTRRIKEGFDPHGVLNPGRMYEGV